MSHEQNPKSHNLNCQNGLISYASFIEFFTKNKNTNKMYLMIVISLICFIAAFVHTITKPVGARVLRFSYFYISFYNFFFMYRLFHT